MTAARLATTAISTFRTSKLGEPLDACEDVAFWLQQPDGMRVALSDGATTSTFSGEWALRLVQWFARRTVHPDPAALARIAPVLGKRWLDWVRRRPLPWHAEEKLRDGSFATLLGVTVTNEGWQAIAIGDTCLFQVRDGALLSSFPYASSEEFAARPILASTRAEASYSIPDSIRLARGELQDRDMLVMATDGLAQWLLRSVELETEPWAIFSQGVDALRAVVDEERVHRRMRNDDICCAWLTI
jgi:hypothetical protein